MMTIAVIDDEATARNMAGRILSKTGYAVETFATGASHYLAKPCRSHELDPKKMRPIRV